MIGDVVLLLAGAGLLGGGMLTGAALHATIGRKRDAAPRALVCSCGHGYGAHKDGTGTCKADVRREHYESWGTRRGWEWVACACLRYDGPEPLPSVLNWPLPGGTP